METTAQAFFLNMDEASDTCQIGAAVILPDQYLAVAGFVGVMPLPVAQKLIQAASRAGVTVTVIHCDGPEKIVALTWGNIDPVELWPLLVLGIAESSTRAIFNALHEATDDIGDLRIGGLLSN